MTFSSYFRLTRLPNATAIAAMYIAAAVCATPTEIIPAIGRSLAWLLAASAAYVFNDIVDVEIDRVNHPSRPLPAGLVCTRIASQLFLLLSAVTVLCTLASWGDRFPWPVLGLLAALFYSAFLRYWNALASNILTAAVIASVPLGAVPHPSVSILAVAVALFGITAAREMNKDVLDRLGDSGERPSPVLILAGRYRAPIYLVGAVGATAAIVFLTIATSALVFTVVLIPLIAAATLEIVSRNDRAQSVLLKVACYLFVPVLIIASSHARL